MGRKISKLRNKIMRQINSKHAPPNCGVCGQVLNKKGRCEKCSTSGHGFKIRKENRKRNA